MCCSSSTLLQPNICTQQQKQIFEAVLEAVDGWNCLIKVRLFRESNRHVHWAPDASDISPPGEQAPFVRLLYIKSCSGFISRSGNPTWQLHISICISHEGRHCSRASFALQNSQLYFSAVICDRGLKLKLQTFKLQLVLVWRYCQSFS